MPIVRNKAPSAIPKISTESALPEFPAAALLGFEPPTLEQLRMAEGQLYPPIVQGSRSPDFRDHGVPWTSNNNGGGLSGNGIHNGSDFLPLTDDNFNATITHLRAADEVLKNRLKEMEKRQMHLEAIVKALTGGRISGV